MKSLLRAASLTVAAAGVAGTTVDAAAQDADLAKQLSGHNPNDFTDPVGPPKAIAARFASPEVGAMRVVKGGSWLCAPSYCLRYRPAARQPSERGLGSNHIRFRIAQDSR